METKIRTVNNVLGGMLLAALLASVTIENGYVSLLAGIVGAVIGYALRKKFQKEPDEMALQMELFSSHVATGVMMGFIIVMMAVEKDIQPVHNAYMRVMLVWLAGWAVFKFALKRVMK